MSDRIVISRGKLIFGLLVGLGLGAFSLIEVSKANSYRDRPLETGTIIGSDIKQHWLGYKRPVVSVRLDSSSAVVNAVLAMDTPNKLPQRVTFHYSGDPSREVYLQEESNPAWLAVFSFSISTFLGFALWKWGTITVKIQERK